MTAAPAAPHAPKLTLSAPLLSTLQPASYLHHHLTTSNTRPTTSRTPSQPRALSHTPHPLNHPAGSALVRLGATTVVAGIQAELLDAKAVPDPPRRRLVPAQNPAHARKREQEDIARLGLLIPNVELATGGSALFLPGEGRAPGTWQQSCCVRLLRGLLGAGMVRLEDLSVLRGGGREKGGPGLNREDEDEDEDEEEEEEEEIIAYWTLYITLLPLSLDGTSSLYDALWIALVAALRDVKLPHAWWDVNRERIVCSDSAAEAHRLSLRGMPVCLTFGVFTPGPHIWTAQAVGGVNGDGGSSGQDAERKWVLADPDGFEDGLCEETCCVVVDLTRGKKRIVGVEKSGGAGVGMEELREMMGLAEERWIAVREVLGGG